MFNFIEKYKIILIVSMLIVLLLLFILSTFLHVDNGDEQVKNGKLDLTHYNFSTEGMLKLDGNWEFYWNKLLTKTDFKNDDLKPDLYIYVPQVWSNYHIDNKQLSGTGFATYRLHIKTNFQNNEILSLRLNTISSAYKLMIDNKVIAQSGIVSYNSNSSVPQYKLQVVSFTVPDSEFDLIIQVSNYDFHSSGLWTSIYLGNESQISKYQSNLDLKEMFILGILLFLTITYFSYYLLMREYKYTLYFGILTFLLIFVIDTSGQLLLYHIFPYISYDVTILLTYLSTSWMVTIFALFTSAIFPLKWSKLFNLTFIIVSTVFSLFYIFTPPITYTSFASFFQAYEILPILYALIITVISAHRKRKGAVLYLIGIIICLITYIHDNLYLSNRINSPLGEIMNVGILLLILIQSYIQTNRFFKAYHDIKNLDVMKDEFLVNTSHELKTPLNGIINIAYGLNDHINDFEMKKNINYIISSGKRLEHLVDDILDYTKLKYKEIKLNFITIDLHHLLDKVFHVLQYSYGKKNVTVVNKVEQGTLVKADENRLVQILYNLIGNALKYTDEGIVQISTKQDKDIIEIIIEDSGIGISKEQLEIIFLSYEQLEPSITNKHKGTGLGLSITKRLVELHKGKIWFDSEIGKGTRVHFTLPLPNEMMDNQIKQKDKIYNYRDLLTFPYYLDQGDKNILIVDDDVINLQAAIMILKNSGYSITAVNQTEDALTILRNRTLDLVILDVMMPGISGYDLCREIRKRYTLYDLPVLMLTVKTGVDDIVASFEAGANDFLNKPFTPEELISRVRTLISLKQSVDKALENEISFLQAQIKPHFLYNTLSVIASLSNRNPKEGRKLIVSLSNYLRTSFDFNEKEYLIPLEKELELVHSYITIEKARFGERIKYEEDINRDLLSIKIPRLVLQPLIENALNHGILKKENGGKVILKINRFRYKIWFEVIDNGKGMDKSILKQLLKSDISGIGLKNIDKRLLKYYNTKLRIKSKKDIGTIAVFCIPYKEVNHIESNCSG